MTEEQKIIVHFVRATDWRDPDNEDLRAARQSAADIIPELRGNPDIASFYEKVLNAAMLGSRMLKASDPVPLPMREWLELGQAFQDKCWMPPKYFRAHQTQMIEIGRGLSVKADGKTYRAGRYCLGSVGV